MEDLMITITPMIVDLLKVLIMALIGWLMTNVTAFVQKRTTREQRAHLKEYAYETVEYVQQIAKTSDAANKFELAKSKIIVWANEKGIPVTDEELETLIESAVFNLKLGAVLDE